MGGAFSSKSTNDAQKIMSKTVIEWYNKGGCFFATEHDDWDQFSDWLEHQLLNKDCEKRVIRIDKEMRMFLDAILMPKINPEDIDIINSCIKKGVSLDVHHFRMSCLALYDTYVYFGTPLSMAVQNPEIPLDVVESLISPNNINKVLKIFPDHLLHQNGLQTLGRLNTVIELAAKPVTFWYILKYRQRTETSRSELVSLLLQYGAEVPGLHAIFEENSYNLRKDGLKFQSALTIRRAIKVKKSMDVYTSLKKLPSTLIEYCTLRDFNEEVIEKLKDIPTPRPEVALKHPFRMLQNENVNSVNCVLM